MSHVTFTDVVSTTAKKFKIPGVAVGVFADGKDVYACHGVTSLDNPLPVDKDTLYVLGSLTKTSTATTIMRLVAEGKVALAPFAWAWSTASIAWERTGCSLCCSLLWAS